MAGRTGSKANTRSWWLGLVLGCFGFLAVGCTAKTRVEGVVLGLKGKPVVGATVVLGHTAALQTKGATNAKGQFRLVLRERCFPICGGGNPSLKATKAGLSSQVEYAPWDKTTRFTLRLKKASATKKTP
ncbi:MAG: carboxypeptidase regulatory-like domain-containing protein [Deltaproteobacteria bacterium]|nr:MAG: carboxypeptidase regulatory-like domain-containing protein [Deltaproteobacteria bacterium]